jgi:ubiquinone/menaquinone biosynthesis C-methylase UbiE
VTAVLEMDARQLAFEDSSFDVIVDKGTLDAILCSNESVPSSTAMLGECSRCLKPGGRLFVVTYGAPATRLNHLEQQRLKWDVKHASIGNATTARDVRANVRLLRPTVMP